MTGAHSHDPKRMLQANTQRDNRDKNIKITLENQDLWNNFHGLGTEMIITKCGRYVQNYLFQISIVIVAFEMYNMWCQPNQGVVEQTG